MTKPNHERIWLEPGEGGPEGRLWCQDDVWSGNPDYAADGPPTEYVHADLCVERETDARAEGEAKGRREEIEECAKVAFGHNGISPRDSRDIAAKIRARAKPASDVDRIERDGILFREGEAKGRREAIEKCAKIIAAHPDTDHPDFDTELMRGCCELMEAQVRAVAEPADGGEK